MTRPARQVRHEQRIVLGIDVGKTRHQVTCLTDDERVRWRLSIATTAAGFARLGTRLAQLYHDATTVVIGFEATGHYYENLFGFILAHTEAARTTVVLLNPLTTSAYAKAELNTAKTDRVDADLIARYLLRHPPTAYKPADVAQVELRRLTRLREALVMDRGALTNTLHAALDVAFPELPSLVRSLTSQSMVRLLVKYPTASAVRTRSVAQLAALLHGRHGRASAERIRTAAQTSIGVAQSSTAVALEVRQLAERIQILNTHITAVEKAIATAMQGFVTAHLETIPGIGPSTLSVIVAEVGDQFTTRFRSAEALVAFTGIAPRVRQSGRHAPVSAPMSKRGSTRLRRALMLSAVAAIRVNPRLRTYYFAKIAAGKKKMVALGAVARKLVHLIWGVARGGKPFDPHYPNPLGVTP